MKGLFRSLFRNSEKHKESIPSRSVESLDRMSIEDILAYTTSTELKTTGQCAHLLKRLYNIALYDNHVLDQHREIALKLAEALTKDVEKALSGNPDGLAALQKANNYMIENARLCGVGSLSWKITEESISAADTLPYVMRPEHRHLVPAYLEALGEKTVTEIRKELVRQLIFAGQYEAHNAVLILHGLVTKGDEATTALFTREEYAALAAVPDDYGAGRRVLVNLGLLSNTSNARPLKEIPEIQTVVALVLKERSNEAELNNRLAGLSEDQRHCLLLALTFLRFHLAFSNIRQIYSEELSNSLFDIFTEQSTKEVIEQFARILHVLYEMPLGKPMDLLFLDSVMAFGGIEVKSEDDLNRNRPFFDMGAAWLNRERVEFQCYLRFILRAMSDPVPQIKSVGDEQVVAFLKETYLREGSRAGIAENATYSEDWIGTNE
jgi:hypothetical protein